MFRSWKVTAGSVLAVALLLTMATQWPKLGRAAGVQRQVHVPTAWRYDPVVITKVVVGNAKVQAGRFAKPSTVDPDPITPFEAGDDWIQNLSVYFLNRTSQTIVAAEINLGFPETSMLTGRPPRGCVLKLGRRPAPAAFDRTGQAIPQPSDRLPLSFGPGQTMVVGLGDYMGQIGATVNPVMLLAAVTSVRIDLIACYFADGTRFAGGGYSSPDPDHPGRWRGKGSDYSPGLRRGSWPGQPGWPDQQ
jgi:hypothetical protein